MIDARELRIGNWVQQFQYGFDHKINSGVEIDNIKLSQYEPIPITPAVLEKCGFVKIEDGVYRLNGIEFIFSDSGLICDVREVTCHCYHLHQLMNLYFALTGDELNYQP